MKPWSISRNTLKTQPTKRETSFSWRSDAEPASQAPKFKMPPKVQVIPQASTNRTAFEWEASFNMTRSRSLVSENIEGLLGLTEVITFPGPDWCRQTWLTVFRHGHVYSQNCGENNQCHRMGDQHLERRPTGYWSWLNGRPGFLVSEVPDNTNPRGHPRETRTVGIPGGGSAQTRSARTMTHPQSATHSQSQHRQRGKQLHIWYHSKLDSGEKLCSIARANGWISTI